MDLSFEKIFCGLGFNATGYPGAFTPTVNRILQGILVCTNRPRVLHLFSGVSDIGNVRVDIERPEATHRQDVLSFLANNDEIWDYVILDPPYEIKRKSKLYVYGRVSSVAADVQLRGSLVRWFHKHALNVIWLDMCAPLPKGFKRKKFTFFFLVAITHSES